MSILGIIPARYASTRFPGKPLAEINGRAMILRVADQAILSGVFDDLLIATDDDRIFQTVREAGYNAVMTSAGHRSGTDRCREALDLWEISSGKHFDFVINIQGDEPFIHPDQIQKTARLLTDDNAPIATLAKPLRNQEEIESPNVVKVVFNLHGYALYFSRSPIPYLRDKANQGRQTAAIHFKHIGIYGFRSEILRQVSMLPESTLEKTESLEQLRWLENGLQIKLDITEHESVAIDSPADLLKITNMT